MKGNNMTQQKKVSRKIGKVLTYGGAFAVAVLVVAHFAWKYSGSGQWELWRDKKGVKIYSMKVPGSTRLHFKTVTQIHAKLDSIVAAMTDTTTEGCRNFIPTCTSGPVLKPWDAQSLNYVQAYRIGVKPPFSPRDLVIKTQVSHDAKTRAVQMDMTAVPELVGTDSCCVRMTEMNNRWRFTPLDNGMVEVEFTQNDDPRVPYFMYNRAIPIGLTWLRRNTEQVFNKEKYRSAQFAFLNAQ
jgi:hypothetical protein